MQRQPVTLDALRESYWRRVASTGDTLKLPRNSRLVRREGVVTAFTPEMREICGYVRLGCAGPACRAP